MAKEEEPNCKWITLTKRILEAPDRFPDFTIEGSQVYRHLGHRPEEEDYPSPTTIPPLDTSERQSLGSVNAVKQCEKCQKFKVSQLKPAGRMLTRQVEEPFGTHCADFVGPLPRSKHGNTMLLVFFDAFTKWVELVPLRMATSAHLERAFREAILSRF
ncbi:hypothetical protein ACLKA6_004599 [Drosophila palustris]